MRGQKINWNGTLEERFWRNVDKGDGTGCWLWTGATDSSGYGCIGAGERNGKLLATHRLSWEIANGPIPKGLCVLHKCDTRNCVSPKDLFLGTKYDNAIDRDLKDRNKSFPGDSCT
jgi:hypothetical protein